MAEGEVGAVAEGAGQSEWPAVPDEVRDAELAGDVCGTVARAVVDDEGLDGVDAGDVRRDRREDQGEGRLFVEAGDLDDHLHGQGLRRRRLWCPQHLNPGCGAANRVVRRSGESRTICGP